MWEINHEFWHLVVRKHHEIVNWSWENSREIRKCESVIEKRNSSVGRRGKKIPKFIHQSHEKNLWVSALSCGEKSWNSSTVYVKIVNQPREKSVFNSSIDCMNPTSFTNLSQEKTRKVRLSVEIKYHKNRQKKLRDLPVNRWKRKISRNSLISCFKILLVAVNITEFYW